MTDETKPVRVRGRKEQEAAYRAGFIDGYNHALEEHARHQEAERAREAVILKGLTELHVAPKVRRTRRANGSVVLPVGTLNVGGR